MKATIFLVYRDDSEMSFDVVIDDTPVNALASIMMIARGTLMASTAIKVTAYNDDGSDIASYVK